MRKTFHSKFLLILITLLLSTYLCKAQNGAINLSFGVNRQISNRIKEYNTGGHFSPGIEYRFNSSFALEGMVQFGVHNFEDNVRDYIIEAPPNYNYPSLQIRNTEFTAGITPKIFFSSHKGNWEYFAAPQLLLYSVKSDISIHNIEHTWYGYFDKKEVIGYYNSENNLSLGIFVGTKRIKKNSNFSIQLGWQHINFGKTMNHISEGSNIKPPDFQTNQVVLRVCVKWNNGFTFLKDIAGGILWGLI